MLLEYFGFEMEVVGNGRIAVEKLLSLALKPQPVRS